MSKLSDWMDRFVEDFPPLTGKQRDLIAACFSGVELEPAVQDFAA